MEPGSLVVSKEEKPVLEDRTTDRAAKLVPLKWRGSSSEKVLRVGGIVTKELEERTMELVGARLGHDIDYRAAGESKLRVVLAGVDLNLLNTFNRRCQTDVSI